VKNKVAGGFVWVNGAKHPKETTLDLRYADIATFHDAPASWPDKENLRLNGLVYNGFGDDTDASAAMRINWLHRQPDEPFHTQPYEQLAKVLKESGDERGAGPFRQESRPDAAYEDGLLAEALVLDSAVDNWIRP